MTSLRKEAKVHNAMRTNQAVGEGSGSRVEAKDVESEGNPQPTHDGEKSSNDPRVVDVLVAYLLVGVSLAWAYSVQASSSGILTTSRLSGLVGLFVLLALDEEVRVLRKVYREKAVGAQQWKRTRPDMPNWNHPMSWVEGFQRVLVFGLIASLAMSPIIPQFSSEYMCTTKVEAMTDIVCAEPDNVILNVTKSSTVGSLWTDKGFGYIYYDWTFDAYLDFASAINASYTTQRRWRVNLTDYNTTAGGRKHSQNHSFALSLSDFVPKDVVLLGPVMDPGQLGELMELMGVPRWQFGPRVAFQMMMMYRSTNDTTATRTTLTARVISYVHQMREDVIVQVGKFRVSNDVQLSSAWGQLYTETFISSAPGLDRTIAIGIDFAGFKVMLSGELNEYVVFYFSELYIPEINRTVQNIERAYSAFGNGVDESICYGNYKRKSKNLAMMYGPLRKWKVEECSYSSLLSGVLSESLVSTLAIMLISSLVLTAVTLLAGAVCFQRLWYYKAWHASEIFGGLSGRLLAVLLLAESAFIAGSYSQARGSFIFFVGALLFSWLCYSMFMFFDVYYLRQHVQDSAALRESSKRARLSSEREIDKNDRTIPRTLPFTISERDSTGRGSATEESPRKRASEDSERNQITRHDIRTGIVPAGDAMIARGRERRNEQS